MAPLRTLVAPSEELPIANEPSSGCPGRVLVPLEKRKHLRGATCTFGPALRIPNIKNMGRNMAPETLRICPYDWRRHPLHHSMAAGAAAGAYAGSSSTHEPSSFTTVLSSAQHRCRGRTSPSAGGWNFRLGSFAVEVSPLGETADCARRNCWLLGPQGAKNMPMSMP